MKKISKFLSAIVLSLFIAAPVVTFNVQDPVYAVTLTQEESDKIDIEANEFAEIALDLLRKVKERGLLDYKILDDFPAAAGGFCRHGLDITAEDNLKRTEFLKECCGIDYSTCRPEILTHEEFLKIKSRKLYRGIHASSQLSAEEISENTKLNRIPEGVAPRNALWFSEHPSHANFFATGEGYYIGKIDGDRRILNCFIKEGTREVRLEYCKELFKKYLEKIMPRISELPENEKKFLIGSSKENSTVSVFNDIIRIKYQVIANAATVFYDSYAQLTCNYCIMDSGVLVFDQSDTLIGAEVVAPRRARRKYDY